ncbi:transposase [Streptomyces sp. NPDC053741]|uniref:transposase n=1 Tax=Streptomyces TaxID=1883 RepID=UPI0034112131
MGVGRDGAGAAGLRARCRIPESEHHRPKWQLALDMLDEQATVGLRPAVLFADTGTERTPTSATAWKTGTWHTHCKSVPGWPPTPSRPCRTSPPTAGWDRAH